MMPVTLRPYQITDINRLRDSFRHGAKAPLYQLSTGGGKTVVFSHVTMGAMAKGTRTLIVCHRRELIKQASAKLTDIGVPHGIIAAGEDRDLDSLVLIASVQTIANRLDTLPQFGLIILDEAHHAVASTWKKLLDSQPRAKLLGVTATPARLDGKGLGKHCDGFFDAIVCGPSMSELIADGFLAPTRVLVPAGRIDTTGLRTAHGDFKKGELDARARGVTGNAVEEFKKLPAGTTAIAFCVTVAHAELVARAFRDAGIRSECVHGDLDKDVRAARIADLATGAVQVLTSCEIISEGLDVPSVGAVILLRPTKSLTMCLQQIGRGMRPAPGKTLIVLDHAGNCLRHGLPEDDRAWTLDGVQKQARPGWECPHCHTLNPMSRRACKACGFVRQVEERDGKPRRLPVMDDAEMVQLQANLGRLSLRALMSKPRTLVEFQAYARARGYKPGWAWYRLREQQEGK